MATRRGQLIPDDPSAVLATLRGRPVALESGQPVAGLEAWPLQTVERAATLRRWILWIKPRCAGDRVVALRGQMAPRGLGQRAAGLQQHLGALRARLVLM